MPILNFINCKKESATKIYTFGSSIFSKSSINANISVFEDLNVIQIGVNKLNTQ